MLAQQPQRLLRLAHPLQHNSHQQLHAQILLPMLLRQFSCLRQHILALRRVREQLDCDEIGRLFAGEVGGDGFGVAERDSRAQSEDAQGQGVAGGEGRRVEVDDLLEGAGVEGRVDVDELWVRLVGWCGVIGRMVVTNLLLVSMGPFCE
jgi:hypothetical protein